MSRLYDFPPHRARLAWVCPHDGPEPAFMTALHRAGYQIVNHDLSKPADLTIVDFRHTRPSHEALRKLTALARRLSPQGGVIYLANKRLDAGRRARLRRSGVVLLSGDHPHALVEACREQLRARALAEEAGERLKSLASANALAPVHLDHEDAPVRLLIAGAPAPASLVALSAATEAGIHASAVFTAGQAIAALTNGSFDCLALFPNAKSDPLYSLADALKRRRFGPLLPTLMIAPQGAPLGLNMIAPRHIKADLAALVAQAVQRNRQRRIMRRLIDASAHRTVCDPQANAVDAQFFARHTARLLSHADETGRALSFVGLRIEAQPTGSAPTAAHLSAALRQASDLIARVRRSEDMIARISAGDFVITMPATRGVDAMRAGERIAAILEASKFVTETGEAFPLAVRMHAIEADKDDRLEEALAKLLSGLRAPALKNSDAHLAHI